MEHQINSQVRHFSATTGARALLCAFVGLCLSTHAWSALGSDAASVLADQQAWSASSTQSTLGSATLQTQTLPNGVTVRQYLDANGYVFAVGWEGPVLPDFSRLLGMHFAAYVQAVRQQKHGVAIHGADLVMESGGMMRSFSGHAYLPAKLPAGMHAQDIR